MPESAAVYADLTVLDLSSRLSGAFCARLFGDYGADVLLAEPPQGHPLRREGPLLPDAPEGERSLLHAYANANKRSVLLERADTGSLEELVRRADVVVTNEAEPEFDWFERQNPRVVVVSITPYGRTGPLARQPGNELTANALSSWAASQGDPGEPPLKSSANQVGYLAGINAYVGAIAALYERDRGGRGQLVDASELEPLTLVAGPQMLVAEYAGAAPPRHKPDMLRGPIACADGYVSLTLSRAHFWRDAMNVLGLHDLAEDERYGSGVYRAQHRDEYSGRVEAALRAWKRWDLFDRLAEIRCLVGVIQNMQDVAENPHLRDRGFFVESTLPNGRSAPFPGAPFRMSRTPWALRRPAPRVSSEWSVVSSGSDQAAPMPVEPTTHQSPLTTHLPAPLAGVRALVFTQAWSGTFGTELLGLLGADVIQIEARSRPDGWRGSYEGNVPAAVRDPGRKQRAWNTSGLYNAVNLNKRAITLDLSDPRGLELFRQLLPSADVIAENFTPRVLTNLGIGYDALRAIKPDIILASLSAYGATGPYRNLPGIGGTVEPMSGLSSLLGYEDGRPQNSGAMYPDPVSGYCFAAAIIMALHHRNRTGEGQYIDLGMMEATASFSGDALLQFTAGLGVRQPQGNRHVRIAPHGIYAAGDGGWLALSADDESAWHALVRIIGRPELIEDPRFTDMAARKANEAVLDDAIGCWVHDQDAERVATALRAAGVTAAPVHGKLDVQADEHLRIRGFIVEVEHPEAGTWPQTGVPWQFSRTPVAVTRPSPALGQHSREVLAEFLGVTDAEYEVLVAAGVTGDMPPK
ncbi:MAG: CaiB/BaiF CoA transferase family protein [Dehalococcoidia bacterium]